MTRGYESTGHSANKLLIATILILFTVAIDNEAGAQSRMHQVGVLMLIRPDRPQLRGFRNGLREAGYVEGENLSLTMPPLKTPEELRTTTLQFIKQKMSVFVTTGNVETNVVRKITQQVPIVFMPASDPISAGFVKSFARSESNLTGLALIRDVDSYGKQIEVFKDVIPSLTKLVVLYDARPENPMSTKGLALFRKVAGHLSVELDEKPIHSSKEGAKVVGALPRSPNTGLLVMCSSLFSGDSENIVNRAIEKRLPLFSCGWTEQGALISLGQDFYQIGWRASWYVDQILRGAKAQELPVESPTKFELAINLKTANAIGIKIAPEVLQRADRVIR